MKVTNILLKINRFFLGTLFTLSGISKLIDLESFSNSIKQFDIIPANLNIHATLIIPAIEIICGTALLFNIFRINLINKSAIYTLIALITMFSIGVGINVYKGSIFECNCFGALKIFSEISFSKIIFNTIVLILLIILLANEKGRIEMRRELSNLLILTLFIASLSNIPVHNRQLFYILNNKMVVKIAIQRALDLIKNENTVLIDLREGDKYKESHIPKAMSLPIKNLENNKKLDKIPKSIKIILYCSNEICGQSDKAAIQLIRLGYSNIYIVKGGFQSWVTYKKSIS